MKEPGERTFKCGVCGRVLRTEEIPALNTGNLEKEIQTGDGVPGIRVPASLEELADIVLTQEEQESVEKGADIKIILTVTDAEKLVSNAEKEIVQKALNGYERGQYLDISLFKQIDGVQSRIVKAEGEIRIVIEIPEHFRKENADTRAFAVIRVHDGKAVWLEDLDNDKNTITIETDCFSTYVLAYRDEDKADDNKTDDNKTDDNKSDNNKTNEDLTDTKGKGSSSGLDGSERKDAANPENEAVKRDGSAKTGDSAGTEFWLTVLLLSGTIGPLFYSGLRKRRKQED